MEKVRAQLPEELWSRVASCLEKPGELVLFAESAAWAARLKLALAEQPPRPDGRRISVRIQPQDTRRRN